MKEFKNPGVSLLNRDRGVAAMVGLATFVVYGLTLSPGLYVGESLWSSAQALGLAPSSSPVNAVSFWLTGLCMRFLHFTLGMSTQWFSALAGAVCAALLYRLAAFFVYQNLHEENCLKQEANVSLIAGLGTSLVFAFSLGGWYASTRFTIHLVDLMLLLSVIYLFVVYAHKPRFGWLLALAVLYGVGMAQSVYFIVFSPLAGLGCVFALWRNGKLSLMRVSWLASVFMLAMVLSFVLTGWMFYTALDPAVRGDAQLWDFVRQMIVYYYSAAQNLLPRASWIWLLLTTSVPWMVSLFIAGRTLNNERLWSHYILHIGITALMVVALLGMVASPWQIAQSNMRAMIPLFSYVMVAMTTGYLLAYWFLMMAVRRGDRSVVDPNSPVFALGRPLGQIFYFGLAAFVVVSSASNYVRHLDGSKERFLTQMADEILDRMEGRTWMLMNSRVEPYFLDYYLRFQATKRKGEVHVLNMLASEGHKHLQTQEVKEKLISLLPEAERQSMINALNLGVMTFLTDLYGRYPEFTAKNVANWGFPDLIMNSGMKPVPEFTHFGSGLSWKGKQAGKVLGEYTAFMERMDTLLPHTKNPVALVDILRNDLRRHVGFVANNYGVTLADSSSEEERNAFDFFKRVIAFDPANVSARINLFIMALESKDPDIQAERKMAEEDLQDFIDGLQTRYTIFALSTYFGYVRSDELYKMLLDVWTRHLGSGSEIVGQIKDLIDPDGRKGFILPKSNDERLSLLEEQIKANPTNARAYQEIVRLSLLLNLPDNAEKWIREAERRNLGIDLSLELATIKLSQNKVNEARDILQGIANNNPKNFEALSMLAFIMIDQQDVAGVERHILEKMEREGLPRKHYYYQLISGKLALLKMQIAAAKKDDVEAMRLQRVARDHLFNAVIERPDVEALVNLVLELDFAMADRQAARRHAEFVLRRTRNHALASWTLGSLLFMDGDYKAAEEYFKQSIQTKPGARALNDYAEVLRRLNRPEESERYARDAIHAAEEAKVPRFAYAAWDTLARALIAQGKYAEARVAVNESLRIVQDKQIKDGAAQLKLTQLHIAVATNAASEARELVNEIQTEITHTPEALDKTEMEEFRKLREQVSKM